MDAIPPTGAAPQPVGVHEPRPEKPETPARPSAETGKADGPRSPAQESRGDAMAAEPSPKVIHSPGFSGDGLHLRIEVDESTGEFIYLAVDAETGEVMRQYPPEELLERLDRSRQLLGLAVDRRL